jgi:hypothetical protein
VASVALITTRGKRAGERVAAAGAGDAAEDDPAVEAVHVSQPCT